MLLEPLAKRHAAADGIIRLNERVCVEVGVGDSRERATTSFYLSLAAGIYRAHTRDCATIAIEIGLRGFFSFFPSLSLFSSSFTNAARGRGNLVSRYEKTRIWDMEYGM